MKKLGILLTLIMTFVSVGIFGATSSKVDLSKVTIVVGETGWKSKEQGLKAAGLSDTPYNVQYVNFQGGNLQLEAMAAGHLDLALTSEIPPIFASQSGNGGNFKIIAINKSGTLNQELVIPKGSKIKSIKDLKGKKVAYVDSTTAHYFLLKMLEKAGVKWTEITPVKLSTADGLTALLGGQVDALASYGNAIITAKQKGATTLSSAKNILSGNFPIEASLDAIKDQGKSAAIADYLGRLEKFNQWARKNPNKWAEIVAANTKQPVEDALKVFVEGEQQRPTKIIGTSQAGIKSEQSIADAFTSVGLIKNKISVNTFWSIAFNSAISKFSK